MKNILWNPPEPGKTKMAQFMNRVNQVYGLDMTIIKKQKVVAAKQLGHGINLCLKLKMNLRF